MTVLFASGNGRGWCKHIKEWYTKKEPMELAKEMSRVKARHGRSHKTLLRKSHVKIAPNDHGNYSNFLHSMSTVIIVMILSSATHTRT